MDIELLFTALQSDMWKEFTETGKFDPEELETNGKIICADGANLNSYLNESFPDDNKVLLLILDPLRIHSPMKRVKRDSEERVELKEAVSLDAIIDKIVIGKDDNGFFNMSVRHFD